MAFSCAPTRQELHRPPQLAPGWGLSKVPPGQQGPVPRACHQVGHRAGARPGLKLVAQLGFHFDGGVGEWLTMLLGKYLSCGRKRRRR